MGSVYEFATWRLNILMMECYERAPVKHSSTRVMRVFRSEDTKLRFESVSETIGICTNQYYRTVTLKYAAAFSE